MHTIMIQVKEELNRFQVAKKSIETLFIGGGTPSCIEAKAYQPFFDFIAPYLQEDAEITTEANPNSATKKWLAGMFKLGVNRVSFGVQSFNKEKLKFLNRNHAPQEAIDAVQNAKKIGFKNISLDLIYGTSMDTKALLSQDIHTAFSLPINHISAYSLTIEAQTKFFETPEVAYDDESQAFWLVKQIEQRGFASYEISNFGTYQSKHNRGYWEYKDYIGVGAGAVGFRRNKRFYTQNDVHAYIEHPLKITTELLSDEDIKNEKILLGLRSNIGFAQNILSQAQERKAQELLEEKKISYHDKRYYNNNFFLSDELALYITS